ncbi:MAG: hypothetical protein QW815_04920, partial [Nitrososphaerota archaeon]
MKVLPIAVVISLVLGFALGYIIIQYVQQPQIENLQTQLQAKENEIGALNAQISQLRNEVSRLSADITSEKSTSANLQENLNQYRELLAGLENRVSSLTSSNEEAMAQAAGAARRLEQAKASLE